MISMKSCHCNHCRSRCQRPLNPSSFCGLHSSSSSSNICISLQGRRDSSRRSSCSKIYAGDEHWTKVLQTRNCSCGGCTAPCALHTLTQPTHSQSRSLERDTRCRKCSLSSSSAFSLVQAWQDKKSRNVFQSLYARFCKWISAPCRESSTGFFNRFAFLTRFRSDNSTGEEASDELLPNSCRDLEVIPDVDNDDCAHRDSVSSEDCVWASCSSCSTVTVASKSSLTDCSSVTFRFMPSKPSARSTVNALEIGKTEKQSVAVDRRPSSNQTAKHSSVSLSDKTPAEVLFSTWPPSSSKFSELVADSNVRGKLVTGQPTEEQTTSVHRTCLKSDSKPELMTKSITDEHINELNVEWAIPYDDLKFGKVIRQGERHQIYRGRWHGDILIHTYKGLDYKDNPNFLKKVSNLSRIRHENVCLFMGACIHYPKLAVVTSELKGPSLYEKIHLRSDRISMQSRISTARQVALAMGYLHAKGIVMRKLNSRNIHLEPKVKLSLLDHGMAETTHFRQNYACIPRGNMCYVAPEILSTLTVSRSEFHCTYVSTQETDVFAFGTLLFELICEEFPFAETPIESLIWQVCKGQMQPLTRLNCNSALKVLIEQCWSPSAHNRPSFSIINQELQHKTGLHKRHSSSQPERLNRNSFTCRQILLETIERQQ